VNPDPFAIDWLLEAKQAYAGRDYQGAIAAALIHLADNLPETPTT
jgi:hypothetical protein